MFQSSLNKNKVLALRKMGLMKQPAFLPSGALFQAFEKLPEMYEDLTQEELNELAMEVNKMKQYSDGTLSMPTVSKTMTKGQSLLGNVTEAQDLLDQNKLTQSKFEELFPGPDIPDGKDSPEIITDPCKGPNPPAYCFVNQDPTPDPDPTPDRNLGGLAPRFAGSIFDFTGIA